MSNFNELKEKAKATVGAIADVSVELYKTAGEKAKLLAKITKLSAEIAREKSAVRRLYGEIGSLYYELHKSDPEARLASQVTDITDAFARIADRQTEIDILKSAGDISQAEYEEAERDSDSGDGDASGSARDGE
ncbi:MAG: hypothetical protein LBD92_04200 [Oscillospiraceae bacterium]|jgi:phenylpyruvate tautomerase PptA (4-oxalocrotonate tautomerase family)|nr:hypothetical protein [Oscillospiraceae bacterium]